MRRALIPLVLAAFLLASCGGARPDYAWCFFFDFTQSNYGVNVSAGRWLQGHGFIPPTLGNLATGGHVELGWSIYPTVVTPTAAILHVERFDTSVPAPIDFEGEATIFGMFSGWLHTQVPADVNEASLMLKPGQGDGSGTNWSVVATVSRAVKWTGLEVMGVGENPFPQNNCSDFEEPEPEPRVTMPDQDIFDAFGEAQQALNDVNAPLANGRLPADNTTVVFGLMKWLMSPTAAQELLGPFHPVLSHVGIFLVLDVALVGIYTIVYVGVYIVRWAIWLIKTIFLLIQAIANTAGGLIGTIFRFIAR